ncbi:hypothetical protein ThrDRAFT_04305 [Frankia casuarinae]|jgi:hypothetical protein|uniref:hypothetical protein n=1 Tax=Frankia TaxID=1854 RepID=UPI0002F63060|nr:MULTISPECIES: hypothetical protein [Frankia]ETA02052.1 hypothetical protein CcI6DRAFT_02576 [Frankia sp. CcI6]EYT90075.1 hypothetical protein ThrDRAFT_04305 [Frankia casuarinae]KDA42204.1 hypothetical protein BMG523Draft_02940 [Frankia sp. BMG5.23]KEZ35774.1 hypothetical protein CEDDRAFT_02897 [Frankia sp. CeD]KFB04258.1 hypothetical protein ALLO2DRAFT_03030 [Frankia sp. Allo2]
MHDIVTIAATINERPTLEETDAMLAELRRLPRDGKTIELIDELLEFRSLLKATA